jgi:hypothetical protein
LQKNGDSLEKGRVGEKKKGRLAAYFGRIQTVLPSLGKPSFESGKSAVGGLVANVGGSPRGYTDD